MESLAWVLRGSVVGFCLCMAVLRHLADDENNGNGGNGGNYGEEAARGDDES